MSAQSMDRTWGTEIAGEVRTFGGGRQRAITSAGTKTKFGFTLRLVTSTSLDTLDSWLGLAVQVRDHRGRRLFCIFRSIGRIERKFDVTLYDAPIVAEAITASEGV